MTTTLREAAEAAMALGSKLFEDDGHLGPIWLVSTPDQLVVVHGRFDGPDSKDLAIAAIKAKFGDTATRIIFMCECWTKEVRGEFDGIPPSVSPDRFEVIHLIAEDRNGEQLVLTRNIERNEGGVGKLLPMEAKNYNLVSGRFTSFFKPTGTLQ